MENRKKFEEAIEDFQNGYQPKDERVTVDKTMSDKVDAALNRDERITVDKAMSDKIDAALDADRRDYIMDYLNDSTDMYEPMDNATREYLDDSFGISLDECSESDFNDPSIQIYDDGKVYSKVDDISTQTVKMNGGKELSLSVDVDSEGTPLIVGSIDGKEVGKSYDGLDIDFYGYDDNIKYEHESIETYTDTGDDYGRYHYTPPYDVMYLKGTVSLQGDIGIDPKPFLEQNRDSLEKAGFDVDNAKVQKPGSKTVDHDDPDR